MKIEIRFLVLTGPVKTAKTEYFDNYAQAFEAVRKYAENAGFSNVKQVNYDDEYGDSREFRITATTPNGRRGRNIAFGFEGEVDEG